MHLTDRLAKLRDFYEVAVGENKLLLEDLEQINKRDQARKRLVIEFQVRCDQLQAQIDKLKNDINSNGDTT